MVMLSPLKLALVGALLGATTASSPIITASIVSSWPAPSLLVQYLETLALELPAVLFPFLDHLTLTSDGTSRSLFTPGGLANETYTLLESQLGLLGAAGTPERESLRIALGLRETVGGIEGMRRVWQEEAQVDSQEECENWVRLGKGKVCTVDQFWDVVGREQEATNDVLSWPASELPLATFPFDHLSPRSLDSSLPRAVFYASPTSGSSFSSLFQLLRYLSGSTSAAPRLQLVLRWKPDTSSAGTNERMVLSGFGAGLDIKKSEYLTVDDRQTSSVGQAKEDVKRQPQMMPVKKDDIAQLGLRAATYILADADPLAAFVRLTSSFPLLAAQLSTLHPQPSAELSSEVFNNQMGLVAASKNTFYLNGIPLEGDEVEPLSLMRRMRRERRFVSQLLGLSDKVGAKQAREWLMSPAVAQAGSVAGVQKDGRMAASGLGQLFDASDREEGGGLVLWWNDLTKDKRYRGWSTSLQEMLQPTYPGQLNSVALNLHNVVLVLDLTKSGSLTLIVDSIKQFVSRGIPVRFGLVPIIGDEPNDPTTMLAKTIWHLTDTAGRATTMRFMSDLLELGPVTTATVRKTFFKLHNPSDVSMPLNEVLDDPQWDSKLVATRAYLDRLGVDLVSTRESNALGSFFLNGAYSVLDEEFTSVLQRTIQSHTQFLQQQIYLADLTAAKDSSTYFYDLPTTYKRRNRHIFPSPEENPLVVVNLVEALQGVDDVRAKDTFVGGVHDAEDSSSIPPIATIYIVADLESTAGRELVKSALQLVEDKTTLSRVSFLHNSKLSDTPESLLLTNFLFLRAQAKSLSTMDPAEILAWLDDAAESPSSKTLLASVVVGEDVARSQAFWNGASDLVERLGFAQGETGIVINGRVVGPFDEGAFALADLRALLDFEMVNRILPVVRAISDGGLDTKSMERSALSQLYSLATSIISKAYIPDGTGGPFEQPNVVRHREHHQLAFEHSAIIGPNDEAALFEIAVVLDPASELAQRWAPILQTLSTLSSVHLRLYLNPIRQLTELPIKRFYQFTFQPSLVFDAAGAEKSPAVLFEGMPEDVLLTFGMDLQRSWLAFARSCIHDLDNIRLADLPAASRIAGVRAVFELESIIVEGHARDLPSGQPPRGLQLQLVRGTEEAASNGTTVGTIVMSNLGYFQLKANPGIWRLNIRVGKSSKVFAMESIGAQGWKSADIETTGNTLAVTTLEGLTIYPRFRRRNGEELTELLDTEGSSAKTEESGAVERLKSMIPFLNKKPFSTDLVATKKNADINIFTVASGLLYERMAFLMVVSVMRHTNSTVKFWFIQNFLSPSFTAFLPHMAREYNFDYELVTYKWPHWLRAQKEKQRTIWGYKILFLDVLFPLDLDRVIFVDSDQIVRADLKELIDLDLKGAPYGYTPMGNDREETKGFRFWDTGYWKEHLRGRPYHISALYVIDLDRFRQMAAGDRLRQQYQGLSADPGSLANLDQDLPNNMQNIIPIYSLDASWLWCETWCSDETLPQAKTIDLCNNVLTHEPKLARAKRLIPEWTVYDDEVAAFARRIALESPAAAEDDTLNAFSKKADELEQAVQQSVERDEFVEASGGQVVVEGEKKTEEGRKKDEL